MNYLFDNNDVFYPTPEGIIKKMWGKIQNNDYNLKILEPSAGRGDIFDNMPEYIKRHNPILYCIESDFNLQAILLKKDYRLLDNDFLSYDGEMIFDIIIMNPPFNAGAKHLLKAIDILYKGEIVCLLNAETLNNPYTNERKLLIRKLEELNAEIEELGKVFVDGERKTKVDVVLIYIKREKDIEDYFLDGLEKEESVFNTDIEETKELIKERGIEFLVADYNRTMKEGLSLLKQYYKSYDRLKTFLFDDKYNSFDVSYKEKVNNFIKSVKIYYWKNVLELPDVKKRLVSNKKQELEYLLNQFSEMVFSEKNIYQFILNVMNNYKNYIKEAILEVFDRLSRRHAYVGSPYLEEKNIHYFNGWKTNKAFRVNKRVILPVDTINYIGEWNIAYQDMEKLKDIDIVMNYFAGYNSFETIGEACNRCFEMGQTKNIQSTFFEIDAYKKGTLHLKFKDEDLLRKFNIFVCREKKWLPFDYGAKDINKMNEKEKEVVKNFEGIEKYKIVKNILKIES